MVKYKNKILRKYFIKTFGCPMNTADSQAVENYLQKLGLTKVSHRQEADLIIFNTCAIRQKAEDRLFGMGLHLSDSDQVVIVTGCMVRRDYLDEETDRTAKQVRQLKRRMPWVDFFLDIQEVFNLEKYLQQKGITPNERLVKQEYLQQSRQHNLNKIEALIPIMTGCNEFCTYCVVPYARGEEVSRPFRSIINEVQQAIDDGYKKITLLGQIVDKWHDQGKRFADLLKDICDLPGDFWVTFTSPHPTYMTMQTIEHVAHHPKMLKTIGLPLQSGSDSVLERMNRKYTRQQFEEVMEKAIATKIPLYITTDIITGFPSESEDDFQQSLDIIKKYRFNKVFAAPYSPRPGTGGAIMQDKVPEEVAFARYKQVEELANQIFAEENTKLVGSKHNVLINGKHGGITEQGQYIEFTEEVGSFKGSFVEAEIIKGGAAGIQGKILS